MMNLFVFMLVVAGIYLVIKYRHKLAKGFEQMQDYGKHLEKERLEKEGLSQAEIDKMTILEREQLASLRAKARPAHLVGTSIFFMGPLALLRKRSIENKHLKQERKKLGLK